MRADRHDDELLVQKVKHAKMYVGILKYLFKEKKAPGIAKPPIKRQTHLPLVALNAGIIWVRKHEAKLTMTKVLFLQDAKLLLKVTLRFGGRGLHALEMCLVQGYVMTALDALPLWFSYGYTRTKKKGLAEIAVVSVETG